MNFHVGTPGAYELDIEINKKRIFEPSLVKVVEQHAKVKNFRFCTFIEGGSIMKTSDSKSQALYSMVDSLDVRTQSISLQGVQSTFHSFFFLTVKENNELKDVDLSVLFVRIGKPSELQVVSPVRTGTG